MVKYYVTVKVLVSQLCCDRMVWPTSLLCPWNSLGKNTGGGSHSLLQGIFLTQGLNLGLMDCRQFLYCLSHQAQYQSQDGDSDGVAIDLIHILPVLHELVHAHVCVCVCVCVCG